MGRANAFVGRPLLDIGRQSNGGCDESEGIVRSLEPGKRARWLVAGISWPIQVAVRPAIEDFAVVALLFVDSTLLFLHSLKSRSVSDPQTRRSQASVFYRSRC